ncbi:MAG TPA: adenosine kinase [Chloroflexota bacterium]|nr:adenosine kinase [Chloroflexota bacterium]
MADQYDVLGIGNAIVDVLTQADENFLTSRGITKGAMNLIDADQADQLYAAMGPGVEQSGGSVCNTIAGIGSLGGKAAYIGKVRNDQLGDIYRHDLRSLGVTFDTPPSTSGPSTARCLILVTPDAQRTLNTFLGACVLLGPADVDEKLIGASQITFLEGYLFDPPEAKAAFRKAAAAAHAAGRKVGLTLSDSFCVDRYRAEFLDLIKTGVDVLFANEAEITSLFETADFDQAIAAVRPHVEIAAVTRSEKGSVIVSGDRTATVPADKVNVVDTTGAGDLYASGFLYGITHGKDIAEAARLGHICAGEIISHFGARPEASLKELARL